MERIRLMKKEDVKEVSFLEKKHFSKAWSETSFFHAVENPSALYLVMEEEEILGYCGFYISYETADLCNLLVRQEKREQGLGKRMLLSAFKILLQRGVEEVFLEVRVSNEPAIGLYKNLGFLRTGIRKNYYTSPSEDALLMKKILTANVD